MAKKTSSEKKLWKNYEDAVRAIIGQHRELFGLEAVASAPAKIQGKSGYVWNIEVIGYAVRNRAAVLFEVRRKTTRNVVPEEAGALAFRISDTGASKGFFVTPLGRHLSRGAKQVALAHKIDHAQVSCDATPEQYILNYLNQFFVRVTDHVVLDIKDSFRIFVADKDGKPIREIVAEDPQLKASSSRK